MSKTYVLFIIKTLEIWGKRDMKKLLYFAFLSFFAFFAGAIADTITINWLNTDKTINQTTTCNIGGDLILPAAPTKPGYDFVGWLANYTPIEYLESTGTQYIDTDYIPQIGTKLETRIHLMKETNPGQNIAGVASGSRGNLTFFGPVVTSGQMCALYFNSYLFTIKCYANDIITATIDVGANSAVIIHNNETKNNSQTYTRQGVFFPTYSIYLFAGHYDDGADEFATVKMYHAKIWEENVLVRDFIPVIDYNGVPCMYDKVTNQFFYNAGTGDFIAGPVIGE